MEILNVTEYISVVVTPIILSDNIGIARWNAKFTRIPSGIKTELDGIYKVVFDKEDNCIEFRQWWNERKS